MRQPDGGGEFLSRGARGGATCRRAGARFTKPAPARRSTRSSPTMRSKSTAGRAHCRSANARWSRSPARRRRRASSSSFSTSRRPRSDRSEASSCAAYIHARAAKGVAFIFISHKLFEIVDVANRIAVLRNGKLVWRGATDERPRARSRAHDGRRGDGGRRRRCAPLPISPRPRFAFASPATSSPPSATPSTCTRAKSSASPGSKAAGRRNCCIRFSAPKRDSFARVERNGAASFVSGDRLREGVFPLWSVLANVGLGRIADLPMFHFLSAAQERAAVAPSAKRLRLDEARLTSDILELSGGNQQKALVARALVADAPIILLDDPTRGVDVAAKRDFYDLIAEIAGSGRLIIWHSTEDAEFLECDRVLVFAKGAIVAELTSDAITEQSIVDASFRASADRAAGPVQGAGRGWAKTLIDAAPFLSLAVVLAVMLSRNPRIASVFGLDLLLWSAVPVALVALAQMFVVGGSEIDLGVGAFAGLINVLSATWLVDAPGLGVLSLVAAPVAYAALGALIQARKIPAIVVTLGASFIWSGVAYTLQPTPGGSSPEWLTAAIGWSIPHAPTSAIVLALIASAAYLIERDAARRRVARLRRQSRGDEPGRLVGAEICGASLFARRGLRAVGGAVAHRHQHGERLQCRRRLHPALGGLDRRRRLQRSPEAISRRSASSPGRSPCR